jgi:IclR family KDG regulon transcriptional repressor
MQIQTPAARPSRADSTVKSADRALAVFELISQRGDLSFSEIATALGIPKSSTHELLATLHARSYLDFDQTTRTYSLGVRLWQVAQACRQVEIVRSAAQAPMQRLRDKTAETVQLAQLEGRHAVYVAIAESPHAVALVSRPGVRLPAHAIAVGKAMLACLQPDEARRRLSLDELEVFTEHTLSDLDVLDRELAEIRKQGYATDREEFSPGLRCLAMPIRMSSGIALAGLSVALPMPRHSAASEAGALEALMQAVAEITTNLDPNARNERTL